MFDECANNNSLADVSLVYIILQDDSQYRKLIKLFTENGVMGTYWERKTKNFLECITLGQGNDQDQADRNLLLMGMNMEET